MERAREDGAVDTWYQREADQRPVQAQVQAAAEREKWHEEACKHAEDKQVRISNELDALKKLKQVAESKIEECNVLLSMKQKERERTRCSRRAGGGTRGGGEQGGCLP